MDIPIPRMRGLGSDAETTGTLGREGGGRTSKSDVAGIPSFDRAAYLANNQRYQNEKI